jgi:hypothetical protein
MRLHLQQLDWPDDDRPSRSPYTEIVNNRNFSGENVFVDNRHFQNCQFEGCRFVYSGGPFAFYECEILVNTKFSPTGDAHRTMRLHEAIKSLYNADLPHYMG